MFRIINIFYLSLAFACSISALDIKRVDSLNTIYSKSNDPNKKIDLLIEIAEEFRFCDVDTSVVLLKRALMESKKNNYLEGFALSSFKLGVRFRYANKTDAAYTFYNTAYKLWMFDKDTSNICKVLINIGNMYADMMQFDKSVTYQEKCIELTVSDRFLKERGMAMYNIGNTYKRFGSYKKALNYYSEANVIFKKIGDKEKIISCTTMIGILYLEWMENQK